MFLLEHHAKELLSKQGVVVPDGRVATTQIEAENCARSLGFNKFAIKAQIGAGGRGLAGGIKFASSPKEVGKYANELLGQKLVTVQTGARGEIVQQVFIEATVDIEHSIYCAILINQNTAIPTLLGARAGGVDFEKLARENPDIIQTLQLSLDGSVNENKLNIFLGKLDLKGLAASNTRRLLHAAIRTFFETESILIEINPLAITPEGKAIAVDAKMVLDRNALPRHFELEPYVSQEAIEETERIAQENDVNFVQMDGNIGLVVNGAGLGLSTLDMVVEMGGRPANFMDIRTTAGSFQIARVIKMLINNPDIKVLLVNIHGGGMTVCDTIAEAINFAYSSNDRKLPIIYRAAGQNAPWALSIMKDRGLPYELCTNMTQAVRRAVEVAAERTR